MRLRFTAGVWMAVLLLSHSLSPLRTAAQQNAPIKKKGLVEALKIGGLSAAELTEVVNKRGVDFRLTYENEEELRNAGATDPILDSVRKHYRRAATSQSDRTSAANLVKSSRALFAANDPSSALPVVNQSLELDPDNAEAYVLRGHLYSVSGEAKRAASDFDIALQISPGNPEAQHYLQIARNLENTGAPGATALDIPTEGHQGFLGFTFATRNGQVFVLGTLPSGSAARSGLQVGDQLLSVNGMTMKDFEEQYLRTGKLPPGAPVNVQIQRQGRTLSLQVVSLPRPNMGDEAIDYYSQLIQQFPGNPEPYVYRATIYFLLKNPATALEDMNTFVRLNPSEPFGYEQRARIKTALGDTLGAKADQDEATRLSRARTTVQSTVPVPVGTSAFPERWTLLQLNRAFRIRQVQDHVYFEGIGLSATAEAERSTDKKGTVTYKGKWHQVNANGTSSEWRMVLKTVTPQRIEGTVYTRVLTGDPVTFIPQN